MKLQNSQESDHGEPDTRTNGEINLEAIARFQNEIDNNPNYCGDVDDDLEFLARHIDEDPEIFHQYVEMKLQNSQKNGETTNGDINLEAIARFQIEVDKYPNYCGDLDDDLEFLVKHIDEDPKIFQGYVDIVLLYDQEERNNILNPGGFFQKSSVVRGILENGSENEDNESTMSRLSSAEPCLVAEYHRSREGNPGKRNLLAVMASRFRRREQSITNPEFVVESSAGGTDVESLDDGDKIHNAADGVNNGQVWDTGKSLSEKWTILLDECSRDETEPEEGSFANRDMTLQKTTKENHELAELAVNKHIQEHREDRESFMDLVEQLKRENEADAERGSSSLAETYMTLRKQFKENPEIAELAVNNLIQEYPEHRERIVNLIEELKQEDKADAERDSSLYTSDSYRELESHYQTLQQLMKNDPGILDWVVHILIEENPEKRETCATVFDRLKRRENGGNMLNQLNCGQEARTGRGSSSLLEEITSLAKEFKKDPERVELAFNERIRKHPEKRERYVNLLNQLKRWHDAKDEKKVLVKFADGIVSFLNELIEEHPEILPDESDKDTQDRSGKRGGMLSGALRWISEEPSRFDEYTWLKIQNNPEHGREIARMTDYMKLRAKVMTLQELFEADLEQFDQLVEELIQGNQDTGDIVVEEAVDPRQKARNLKALDKLMMHLEQNPMYFGADLIFLLKHIDELPELFDKYVEAIMSYNQEDKDTILYPEEFLKTASRFLDTLETYSGNVTSESVTMALINDEPALFDEYILSRVERNPTQLKLIATVAEDLKLPKEESVATGITNSSTVDRNTEHGEGMIQITRSSGKTDADMKEMTNSGYARRSLEENWSLLLKKYSPRAASAEKRNQPPLETEHPDLDVANPVKYLRESLGDFISLIEKSRYSQVDKSEGGDEDMDDENRSKEVLYSLERLREAITTGGDILPLLKILYALSPRLADGLVALTRTKQAAWKRAKRKWLLLQQLQTDSDYSWIQTLLQVDTGKVKESLEHMMRTVLNRNDTLVMINELKAPFERERIIKDYLMTGRREHFDKILSFVDQYPELLDDVSEDIVKRNSKIKTSVSLRKLQFNTFNRQRKKTTNTTRPIRVLEYVNTGTSTARLNGSKSTKIQDATGRGETILSSLMETDAEVLDKMMKSVWKKRDRQTGDVLRGIRLLKLKMLLDKDSKLLQNVRCIFGFESNDPIPLDAMMKKHLKLINDNYPLGPDTERRLCVAGSANRLGKISDFAENRNEMMKLHNQLQKEGQSISKHEDTSKKIEDVKAIINTLKKDTRGWLELPIDDGDVEMVGRFIKAGIDLEAKDSVGVYTMVYSAVKTGRDEIVEMLIKAGCDIEARNGLGISLLCVAAFRGYIGAVKKLIKAGAAVGDEEIEVAITSGHVDILKTLLKHGKHLIRQSGEEWILTAVKRGHYDMVSLLMKSGITVVEENTWRDTLVKTVKGGKGNGGAIAVLQTDIMSPSLNMNLEYIRLVAKHGDIDLYRQLVLRCKPRYPDIIDLPYRMDLPYFPVGDCHVHRTVTDRQIDSQFQLNLWFQDITEITTLPGYGDVNGLFSSEKLADDPKLHTFHDVSEFCDKIFKESINHAEIKEYKIRFSYRRCGSSAEGTKVSLPDEFDYFLRCHVDIDDFDIKDEGHGYKMISSIKGDVLLNNMINRGSKGFHDIVIGVLTSQEKHKDKFVHTTHFVKGGGTASSEWRIRYKFDDDHSLDISVDIVPVLHVDGWPDDARQNTWLMNKKELQEEGYAFVAKPPSRKSKLGKQFRNEVQQTMWRISFGHLEPRHLAELEQRIKDVYITCKAIRNPDISHMMFKDSDGKPLSLSADLIPSYWLKTVFMFNIPEFRLQKRTLVEMVYIVYSQVATCISRWWLPFYWQPHVNVLEGLSQNPKQCKQAARLMKRLVTGWYMRDGQSDSVEEEETKEGGIYPYLPPKPNRERQARGDNGGEDLADARETRTDDEAIAGGPEDGVGVGGPEVGKRVGGLEHRETDGGLEVGHRIVENGDTISGPGDGKVGGPQDGDGDDDPADARETKKDDEAMVCGPEDSDEVGNPEIDDRPSSPEDGGEDNGADGCSEDDEDSEDEFEVTTYSRTPNTLRDPGYNRYRL